jgi:hypothetical protein
MHELTSDMGCRQLGNVYNRICQKLKPCLQGTSEVLCDPQPVRVTWVVEAEGG